MLKHRRAREFTRGREKRERSLTANAFSIRVPYFQSISLSSRRRRDQKFRRHSRSSEAARAALERVPVVAPAGILP